MSVSNPHYREYAHRADYSQLNSQKAACKELNMLHPWDGKGICRNKGSRGKKKKLITLKKSSTQQQNSV